jgi:hypothetical protein
MMKLFDWIPAFAGMTERKSIRIKQIHISC